MPSPQNRSLLFIKSGITKKEMATFFISLLSKCFELPCKESNLVPSMKKLMTKLQNLESEKSKGNFEYRKKLYREYIQIGHSCINSLIHLMPGGNKKVTHT